MQEAASRFSSNTPLRIMRAVRVRAHRASIRERIPLATAPARLHERKKKRAACLGMTSEWLRSCSLTPPPVFDARYSRKAAIWNHPCSNPISACGGEPPMRSKVSRKRGGPSSA